MNYAVIFVGAAIILSSIIIIFFIEDQSSDIIEQKTGELDPPILNKKITQNIFNYTKFFPPLR